MQTTRTKHHAYKEIAVRQPDGTKRIYLVDASDGPFEVHRMLMDEMIDNEESTGEEFDAFGYLPISPDPCTECGCIHDKQAQQ